MTKSKVRLASVPKDEPPPKLTDVLPADATHHALVQALLMEWELEDGVAPFGYANALFRAERTGLWQPMTLDQLAQRFGRQYTHGYKRCVKVADYRACAAHAVGSCERSDAFDNAVPGVACPGGFWTLKGGTVQRVLLKPDHMQRFALSFDPDEDAEPVELHRFLDEALDSEQQALLFQALGAAVFGLMHQFQLVLLLYGVGGSGKSVIQRLIEALFPPAAVASVGPHRWGHEYYSAAMAHARINLVGELPADAPIPAAAFKSVTGGDLQSARDPNHRPFFFRSTCAHVFNSNTLPSTLDRSEAFFRRWRVLHFKKEVTADRRDPNLARKIIENEMPAVLALAMRGAEQAAAAGTLRTTGAHDEVMLRWRVASNQVLRFLTDPEYCEINPDHRSRSTAVYQHYRVWAADHGNKPFSQPQFVDLVNTTAGSFGITHVKLKDGAFINGVKVKTTAPGLF